MDNKLVQQKHSISLSMDNKQIIEARRSKKIIKSTDAEIRSALAYILTLLGENAARILDFADLENPSCSVIIKSLRRAFPILKIEELKTAFDFAVDHKYEVNLSLYNRNFNSDFVATVIKAYQEYRKPTMKIEQLLIDARDHEPTPEEKQKIIMDGINESFEIYKETGKMPDVCAWMYIELEKSGTIVMLNELKREIWLKAQDILKSRLKGSLSSVHSIGIKEIAKRIENIGQDGELKSIARELALKHYWDEIINK